MMLETMRRLYPRGAASRGMCVDAEGAALGPDCILVRRVSNGYRGITRDEARVVQAVVLLRHDDPDWLFDQCRRIAAALDAGQTALAQIYGLHVPVRELDDAELSRLVRIAALIKANFNPDEPRIPKGEPGAGEWTYGLPEETAGSAGGDSGGGGDDGGDDSGDGAAGGNDGAADQNSGSGNSGISIDIVGGGGTANGGGGGAAAVGSLAAADHAVSLLGDLAPRTLEALAQLAARFAGPTAFLGTLFIPSNQSVVLEGGFDGRPDLTYSYDRDTGVLTVSQSGTSGAPGLLTEGHINADGAFRDGSGRAIGRVLPGGSVVIDPDALPGYLAQPGTGAEAATGAAAQAQAEANNEPKLCPDPSQNHPGARAKDIAYQQYVSMVVNGRALPAGLAVSLWNPVTGKWVYFDDCQLSDGTMIDAKGTGYLDQYNRGTERYPWLAIETKMLRQAGSQVAAAQGRPIEWHFAEREVADYIRGLFETKGIRIRVIYTPWVKVML